MRIPLLAAVTLALIAGSMPAGAASLKGTALVNRGDGFKQQEDGELRDGDMVMVTGDGFVMVSFDDGCVRHLRAPEALTIISTRTCTTTTGDKGADSVIQLREHAALHPAPDATMLIVGAAVVAGGVLAVILVNSSGDSKPKSQ